MTDVVSSIDIKEFGSSSVVIVLSSLISKLVIAHIKTPKSLCEYVPYACISVLPRPNLSPIASEISVALEVTISAVFLC